MLLRQLLLQALQHGAEALLHGLAPVVSQAGLPEKLPLMPPGYPQLHVHALWQINTLRQTAEACICALFLRAWKFMANIESGIQSDMPVLKILTLHNVAASQSGAFLEQHASWPSCTPQKEIYAAQSADLGLILPARQVPVVTGTCCLVARAKLLSGLTTCGHLGHLHSVQEEGAVSQTGARYKCSNGWCEGTNYDGRMWPTWRPLLTPKRAEDRVRMSEDVRTGPTLQAKKAQQNTSYPQGSTDSTRRLFARVEVAVQSKTVSLRANDARALIRSSGAAPALSLASSVCSSYECQNVVRKAQKEVKGSAGLAPGRGFAESLQLALARRCRILQSTADLGKHASDE
ncbi:hypothetical protein MMC07_000429 [Pseudocyphellaria aurata]|nr:hypothetical protein [Pseudocyphellaria aurata]